MLYSYSLENNATFFALDLIDGKLRLGYSIDGNTEIFGTTFEPLLNDGHWHQVTVSVRATINGSSEALPETLSNNAEADYIIVLQLDSDCIIATDWPNEPCQTCPDSIPSEREGTHGKIRNQHCQAAVELRPSKAQHFYR